MRLALTFMTLALALTAVVAEDADPLQSTACIQALEALQAQEAVASPAAARKGAGKQSGPPMLATLETLRRQAARACLGSRLDAPPPVQRFAQPPVAVAPATPAPAAWAVIPPLPAAFPPPMRMPPLKTVTACDPMGCWANDGTRLQRMGSTLFGPLGLCTLQGLVLSCP